MPYRRAVWLLLFERRLGRLLCATLFYIVEAVVVRGADWLGTGRRLSAPAASRRPPLSAAPAATPRVRGDAPRVVAWSRLVRQSHAGQPVCARCCRSPHLARRPHCRHSRMPLANLRQVPPPTVALLLCMPLVVVAGALTRESTDEVAPLHVSSLPSLVVRRPRGMLVERRPCWSKLGRRRDGSLR